MHLNFYFVTFVYLNIFVSFSMAVFLRRLLCVSCDP